MLYDAKELAGEMRGITTIVWLRRDLRLADHRALTDAAQRGAVLPVYIHAPQEEGVWAPGAASRWWLHHSLQALAQSLAGRGLRIIFRKGASLESLRQLLAESGARRVVWQRCYEPVITARDAVIKNALRKDGVEAESFPGALLFEPWEIQNRAGAPFQVFTPFWRNALTNLQAATTLPIPSTMAPPGRWPSSLLLEELQLLPTVPWDLGLGQRWQPGEMSAQRRLAEFLDGSLREYATQRDIPAATGTSLLSPALHFGEISPRQIVQPVSTMIGWKDGKFLGEIGWREFAHHLLFHFPKTPTEPLHAEFSNFRWRNDPEARLQLLAWQRGRTGIPIVDAGMRELWATGYMHNRVRMLVASFLVKNLRIHWLEGARWFWDTLVDADLANNTQGWQWSAGCGADAAPYFRVFNPLVQAKRFDPGSQYIKQWVPEFGTSGYPGPIVDLDRSRVEALTEWRAMRAKKSALQ
jgi:deoxyribodipyrimidine photo-lyase